MSEYRFYDLVELRTHYFQFTGIPEPRLLSSPVPYSTFDFTNESVPESYDHAITLKVTTPGRLNSLRLTSPIRVYEDLRFHSSDSLMPPVVIPLPEEIDVEAGDEVRVRIAYTTRTSWEGVKAIV